MTIADIFRHLISWRWQAICFAVGFAINFSLSIILANHLPLADLASGTVAILVIVNLVWTFIKACAVCPIIGDIVFWSFWLDL